jgi:hypothetical protein
LCRQQQKLDEGGLFVHTKVVLIRLTRFYCVRYADEFVSPKKL